MNYMFLACSVAVFNVIMMCYFNIMKEQTAVIFHGFMMIGSILFLLHDNKQE